MYKHFLKPISDIIIAIIGLIITSPIILTTTIILLFLNNGSAFFIQKRPGKNGQIFSIIKFKTMNDKKDANGELLPDNVRLTPFGSFVRKTSIDELPQLFNILKGDISLIGPRPLLVEYLPLYNKEQAKRHNVKPGITGWAQVNGRNAISWEEKFKLDIYYINNISILLDIKILFLTVFKVFKSEGISGNGVATMEKFVGTNKVAK